MPPGDLEHSPFSDPLPLELLCNDPVDLSSFHDPSAPATKTISDQLLPQEPIIPRCIHAHAGNATHGIFAAIIATITATDKFLLNQRNRIPFRSLIGTVPTKHAETFAAVAGGGRVFGWFARGAVLLHAPAEDLFFFRRGGASSGGGSLAVGFGFEHFGLFFDDAEAAFDTIVGCSCWGLVRSDGMRRRDGREETFAVIFGDLAEV